jgi:hypothetical protein
VTHHVECLVCNQRLDPERRRLHLWLHHPVEAVAFYREPDDSLFVFFSPVASLN